MKEKILVIDDDTDICILLKKYLSKNGYEVELAYTGKSALNYLKTMKSFWKFRLQFLLQNVAL